MDRVWPRPGSDPVGRYAFEPSCGQFECEPFDCVVDVVFVFVDFELPPAARATPTPVPPSASAVAAAKTATLRLGRNT